VSSRVEEEEDAGDDGMTWAFLRGGIVGGRWLFGSPLASKVNKSRKGKAGSGRPSDLTISIALEPCPTKELSLVSYPISSTSPLPALTRLPSTDERLLQAAKSDSEEMFRSSSLSALSLAQTTLDLSPPSYLHPVEIVNGSEPFDINFQDGLGFSALHYAVQRGSTDWFVPPSSLGLCLSY
jgi:hypothetical protein